MFLLTRKSIDSTRKWTKITNMEVDMSMTEKNILKTFNLSRNQNRSLLTKLRCSFHLPSYQIFASYAFVGLQCLVIKLVASVMGSLMEG